MSADKVQKLDAFPIWESTPPFSLGKSNHDIPTLRSYLPEEPNGKSIIVAPGGGYWILADHEGNDYAEYLAMHGYTCFVLNYRLGQHGYRHPAMLFDIARAVRLVRKDAEKYSIQKNKIGVMGSSAGGHLCSTLMTHFDQGDAPDGDPNRWISSRPDFAILCYAVVEIDPELGGWKAENLVGKDPSKATLKELSANRSLRENSPPAFLWHTAEDKGVPAYHSLRLADALIAKGIPCECHVYEKGQHGIGLQSKAPYENVHPWGPALLRWLESR